MFSLSSKYKQKRYPCLLVALQQQQHSEAAGDSPPHLLQLLCVPAPTIIGKCVRNGLCLFAYLFASCNVVRIVFHRPTGSSIMFIIKLKKTRRRRIEYNTKKKVYNIVIFCVLTNNADNCSQIGVCFYSIAPICARLGNSIFLFAPIYGLVFFFFLTNSARVFLSRISIRLCGRYLFSYLNDQMFNQNEQAVRAC